MNPTGKFVIGGPVGDCGLTGRKIIVDTYGGAARHGGGAFSGKDPSKVDRSAAYAARWVAKNVVAAGLADRCEVQVAYAIGVAHPVSVMAETFGTEKISKAKIAELIDEHFDLRPGAFRKELDLHRPIYQKTAAYGHFGREDERLHLGEDRQGRRPARGRRPRGAPRPSRPSVRRVSPRGGRTRNSFDLAVDALDAARAGERPARSRPSAASLTSSVASTLPGRAMPVIAAGQVHRAAVPVAGAAIASPRAMPDRELREVVRLLARRRPPARSAASSSASVSREPSITASPMVLTSRTGRLGHLDRQLLQPLGHRAQLVRRRRSRRAW